MQALPVTILCRFFGAGRALLDEVLLHREGLRVAVVVDDISELDIDASFVERGAAPSRGRAQWVETRNGCICCSSREDLLVDMRRLAAAGRFDHLLVATGTGIVEPLAVSAAFRHAVAGDTCGDLSSASTLVAVVDAPSLLGPHADAGAPALLVEQIDFADVVVIDTPDAALRDRAAAVVLTINPVARIVFAECGRLPVGPTWLRRWAEPVEPAFGSSAALSKAGVGHAGLPERPQAEPVSCRPPWTCFCAACNPRLPNPDTFEGEAGQRHRDDPPPGRPRP